MISNAAPQMDFALGATADAIRHTLADSGFAIEDTVDGPVWSVSAADAPRSSTPAR